MNSQLLESTNHFFLHQQQSCHFAQNQAFLDQNAQEQCVLRRCDSEIFDNTELIQKGIEALKLESTKRSFSQVKSIQDLLDGMEFFMMQKERYGQKLIDKIIYNLKYCFVEKGQILLNPRCNNPFMYILIQGSLITKDTNSNSQEGLEIGNQFGQQVRFNSTASDKSYIETERDCEFIVFSKQSYFNLVGQYEKREVYEKIQFLAKYPFCMNWNFDSLKYMQMDMQVEKFKLGQVVFDEDSQRDKIYMVKQGEFKLMKAIIFQNKSQENQVPLSLKIRQSIEICKLKVGDIFGEEINLVDGFPKRVFKAICSSSKSEVYAFNYSQFREYLTSNQSDSIFEKCVQQAYNQRLDYTDQKIQEKQQIMQNSRFQMTQSRSCDFKDRFAVCQAFDEQGKVIQQKQNQNLMDSKNYLNINEFLHSDIENAQNIGKAIVNKSLEFQSSSLLIKNSVQQGCAQLNQNNQINNSCQFNLTDQKQPFQSGILSQQSSSHLNQMINLHSSIQKVSIRNKNISDASNSTKSTIHFSSDLSQLSKSPQKVPSIILESKTTYQNPETKTTNQNSESKKQNDKNELNQSQSSLLKPRLLKIKQMKQHQSSINNNINFFKEQLIQPTNCIQLFHQLDKINKSNNFDQKNQQEKQIYTDTENHQLNFDKSQLLQQLKSSQSELIQNIHTHPQTLKSQIQFFNHVNNQHPKPISQTSKVVFSQQQNSSFRSNQTSMQDLDQEENDESNKQHLKSKMLSRKRAITLSPTKKQIKDKKMLQTHSVLANFNAKSQDFAAKTLLKIDENKIKKEFLTEETNDQKHLINNNCIQSDISTKNTSRQSTSVQCKIQHENQQQNKVMTNIFYFNSHYLNGEHNNDYRSQITKNSSISLLRRVISQSQNEQNYAEQPPLNITQQEQSHEQAKTNNTSIKSFAYIENQKIINIDKYRIKVKNSTRPSSALQKASNILNKRLNQQFSQTKKEIQNSQTQLKSNQTFSNLSTTLKKAGQNQLSTIFNEYSEQANTNGYIHFPQNNIKKLKIPSKKITEILQIKSYQD
ncbi:cyclic nucleotide-binding domain protein (macronuclear) [Tetrahymena thermophila SB210]|uniref:Cyclic nucleotide-binding domain protein n=1 Tax=Tetrahymena thermophila (strain SB210) TaxID=312017 RepID=W7XC46_TETTS|nr:cyclic nucleotide-binding domain protein [Tetrahymena thermophila SB210]EWS74058.1 cyclic nucleotide-binding domain protein [Tetrahymena thermophila SB210]|eukprot:XP_012653391.1 cyclic nucleotide-binding domain protein [Tetrahymena thermophila SB210]